MSPLSLFPPIPRLLSLPSLFPPPPLQAQFEFALAAVVEETHAMLDAASQRQRH